jgi:hypothetical protein
MQVTSYFKDEVGSWYIGYRAIKGHPSWLELIDMLKIWFFKSEGVSSYDVLYALNKREWEEIIENREWGR